MKYILTKYDDKKFESGDKIRMFPVKRVEITKQQIEWTIKILEATKNVIDCKSYREKLEEIIKDDKK